MIIHDLKQAEAVLQPYVPLSKQLTGKDTTLDRMRPLMKLLGNPEQRLKVIHIAGTSGKTSTAYYISALLTAAGQKVGLTVSPHIDSVIERIQINGQPIDTPLFCQELGEFMDVVAGVEQKPSYFELLTAFALWVFDRQDVDYAVVETGLGGLHDATNVTERTNKTCVITDIGFDHTHFLGKTLAEITSQKIGIVHDGNQVFMYQHPAEVMQVVEQWVRQHHAKLNRLKQSDLEQQYNQDLTHMADYQKRNWLLAYAVYVYLIEVKHKQSLTSQALRQTQQIQVPGRMDARIINNKALIMDGAHNLQKMTAFVESFRHLYPNVKPAILLALKDDKDYGEIIPLIKSLAARVIATGFNTHQDLPVDSIEPSQLSRALRAGGIKNVKPIADQHAAYEALLDSPENPLIITGSLYLLAEIRNNEGLT